MTCRVLLVGSAPDGARALRAALRQAGIGVESWADLPADDPWSVANDFDCLLVDADPGVTELSVTDLRAHGLRIPVAVLTEPDPHTGREPSIADHADAVLVRQAGPDQIAVGLCQLTGATRAAS